MQIVNLRGRRQDVSGNEGNEGMRKVGNNSFRRELIHSHIPLFKLLEHDPIHVNLKQRRLETDIRDNRELEIVLCSPVQG